MANKLVVLPITIFGQLYGQDVTVTAVDLYYTVLADLAGINNTSMRQVGLVHPIRDWWRMFKSYQ